MHEHGDAAGLGNRLAQEVEALGIEFLRGDGDARDVPFGSRDVGGETLSDGIASEHDDRNGAGRRLNRRDRRAVDGEDRLGSLPQEFLDQAREILRITDAGLDHEVLSQ